MVIKLHGSLDGTETNMSFLNLPPLKAASSSPSTAAGENITRQISFSSAAASLVSEPETPSRLLTPGVTKLNTGTARHVDATTVRQCFEEAPVPMLARAATAPSQGLPQASSEASVEVVRYDILTLRQWFNSMDIDHDGHITKQEWFSFLSGNIRLRHILLHREAEPPNFIKDRFSAETVQMLQEEAKELKKLTRIMRELDANKNGMLEFDEFVDLFRRSGHLMQYRLDSNPRIQMAGLLGGMHNDLDNISEVVAEEFEHLAKWNLQGERRRVMELHLLQQVDPTSPAALRIQRKHLDEHSVLSATLHHKLGGSLSSSMRSTSSSSHSTSAFRPRAFTPRATPKKRAGDFSMLGSRMMGLA